MTEIRDRRRSLRYRHLMVQMKNRISGLLLETGVSHNEQRLHKVGYFREFLATNPEIPDSIRLVGGAPIVKGINEGRLAVFNFGVGRRLQWKPLALRPIESVVPYFDSR